MFSTMNRFSLLLLAGTALSAPVLAQELPSGGSVAAGSVGISTPGAGTMNINQSSQSAVVNWNSFSIGAGGVVNIAQPNGQSVILNRVNGAATTSIAGQLNANGQVYIVNPNGIAITSTGTVNAGGFVGSTLGISDSDFLSGNYNFVGDGSSAGVSNAGSINIGSGGYAALLGGRVDNSGVISAPLGKVGLGAGERATLDLSGDGFLQVTMPSADGGQDALISNSGRISADGGRVEISAAAAQDAARRVINLSGVTEARTVSGHSGAIVLGGGGGKVTVSGSVDVSARNAAQPAKGGAVTVTGAAIELAGATIDASGIDGGGNIRIGGDYYGKGILPNAQTLSVDDTSILYADAIEDGDGGGVVLWSDLLTNYSGYISARGAGGGSGGFVEVSGKDVLSYRGLADLRSPGGTVGTLLLDPYNITIIRNPDGPLNNNNGVPPQNFQATGDDSQVDADVLQTQLETANVTITTAGPGTQDGDITVASDVSWSAATILTLLADRDINLGADILSVPPTSPSIPVIPTGAGGLVLNAQRDINFAAVMSDLTRDLSMGPLGLDITAGRNITASGVIGSQISVSAYGNLKITAADVVPGGALTFDEFDVYVNGRTGTTVVLAGPLAIGAPSSISSDNGDVVISAAAFQNGSGPTGITAPNGRVLVYTTNWGNDTPGPLTGSHLYGRTFALNPPSSLPITGNYFLYADRPTLTLTTVNGTRMYYDASTGFPLPTYSGLVNGDTIADVLSGLPAAFDSTPISANVGTYVGAVQTNEVTSLNGYLMNYVNGDMVVTPAPLTITADDDTKTYGQNLVFDGTKFTKSALRGADTVTSVVLNSAGAAASATVAGAPYAIVASGAAGTGIGNYAITYNNGALDVTPASLTISAKDLSKIYGEMLVFNGTEFNATGLVNADSINFVNLVSDGADADAAIGPYAILASGATGTGLENYNITYANLASTLSVVAEVPLPSASGLTPPFGASRGIPFGALDSIQLAAGSDDTIPGVLSAEPTTDSARLSLEVLQQRSQTFKDEISECDVQLDQGQDTQAFISCASNALEAYGDALDDPLIQLPPELQGTVSVIRQTVARLRTAATRSDQQAAIAEARGAVRDLVAFVRGQTDLVRAVEPETEALLVQHGEVMTQALESMDLALVGAVEI